MNKLEKTLIGTLIVGATTVLATCTKVMVTEKVTGNYAKISQEELQRYNENQSKNNYVKNSNYNK